MRLVARSRLNSGERLFRNSRPSSVSGLPTRVFHTLNHGFQYSGIVAMNVRRFEIPKMSTMDAKRSGVLVAAVSAE